MSNLTIWRFTKWKDSVSEIPKSSFDGEQYYDAYRPIYAIYIYTYKHTNTLCWYNYVGVKKLGQKLTNYTELVSYIHIHNVKCCIKSISKLDDVSYASFCTMSNLGSF